MALTRRNMIRNMILASAGTGLSISALNQAVDTYERYMKKYPGLAAMDAFEQLKLLRFGTAVAQGASSDDDTCIITVKVMNHIHSPLCFKFMDYTGSANIGDLPGVVDKVGQPQNKTLMRDAGVENMATNPRWANLRLNQWFANILQTGADLGQSPSTSLRAIEKGAFPNEVALQAFLHLDQNLRENHSFKNTGLENVGDFDRGGNLAFHLQAQNLIKSPFGICCLNMGNTTETTDGNDRRGNHVLSGNLSDTAVNGKTVGEYVETLIDSIGTGFIDADLREAFNNVLDVDTQLVESIISSSQDIVDKKSMLEEIAAFSQSDHELVGQLPAVNQGSTNLQAFSQGVTGIAKQEFLAQCLFASRSLELPGKPLRNFSLFLNIYDIDKASLDVTIAQGSGSSRSRPVTYIEGMRQLAMGMNILAQTIKNSTSKVYVVVLSEGGRDREGGDNKVSHAFLMGPKSSISDHIYENTTMMADPTSSPIADINKEGNSVPYMNGELKTSGGTTDKTNKVALKHVLNGVIRHIESETGAEPTTEGMGGYVEIKKS